MIRDAKWPVMFVMVLAIVLLLSACRPIVATSPAITEPEAAADVDPLAQFEADVENCREELKIPGLSAAIVKVGGGLGQGVWLCRSREPDPGH